MVQESFENLKTYCEQEGYAGWDNFDGLNSKVFRNSPLYNSRFLRLAWIQFFKRSPINFRKLTLVPKGINPKGLALFVSGLVFSGDYEQAKSLLGQLESLTCDGYSEACWGYNFDWQSRGHMTSLGTPNIVTTVFVANACLDYFEQTNDEKYLEIAESSCRFFLNNLILHEDKTDLCFGYMPGANTRVHNVNMLAAALLARIYSITDDKEKLNISRKAMLYSVKAMNSDYSWNYGESNYQQFIDSFHTGFNLVSLSDWMKFSAEPVWEEELGMAYDYYINNFWLENGCPKYYNNSLFPIDIHCSAQGIVTILKLNSSSNKSIELLSKISKWVIENMQDESGYFYYQKHKIFINKLSYIRWSQAWMYYSLSLLLSSTCLKRN